jgi:phosphoribosylanthranilate isomerase
MLEDNLIQIAGVKDAAEAELLRHCGVRYLGFPLRLAVHQEDLTEKEAAAIIRSLEPPTFGVLITYLDTADAIAEFCRSLGTQIVQLHGDIDKGELEKLKALNPWLTVIKSLVVGFHSNKDLESMTKELSPFVDVFITDSFDPETGATGATGKTHDWNVSRRIVENCRRPVILAGGLTPDNVRRAILEVKPAGVDAHTGVEDSAGRKSREKVERFVSEAHLGFRALKR